MRFPSMERVYSLREEYPKGTRVELVSMEDLSAPPPGTQGSVRWVDDCGTIHVDWDNGSHLGAVFGEDVVRRVK